MGLSDKSSKIWMAICLARRSGPAVSLTRLCLYYERTTPLACLLGRQSVVKSDEKICPLWAIRCADHGILQVRLTSTKYLQASRYLAGCFYVDSTGLFESNLTTSVTLNGPTTTLQAAVNAGSRGQSLVLVRPQGVMEVCTLCLEKSTSCNWIPQVWNLPKLVLVFSTSMLSSLQNILTDSHDPPASSLPQDPPRKPQELDIEQILLSPIGESSPQPHLLVCFLHVLKC